MSIFAEFGGRSSYYTANEIDRLQNPEKYDYDQAGYDAFAAAAAKKADARQAALEASQDAIPYSYVGRGTGATNPAFSFAGYSGHTSGGTSGLSGFGGLGGLFGGGSTTETQGSSDGGGGTPPGGGGGGPRDGGPVQHRAEGGVMYPVQHMQKGGTVYSTMPIKQAPMQQMPIQRPIETPFADPIKSAPLTARDSLPAYSPSPTGASPFSRSGASVTGNTSPGIAGVFEAQFGGGPLETYQTYLMNTYGDPAMENIQQMVSDDVTYFVDLVNQAEQAHFGSGSGGNLMEQGPESAAIPPPIKQAPINNPVSIGFELPQNFGSDPYSPVGNMSPGIAGGFGGF
jgi:hypothetical protein